MGITFNFFSDGHLVRLLVAKRLKALIILIHSQNDIGGGLVRFDQNKKLWFLVGVYSNGAENCENDRKPAVYVDVAKHYKWIEKSYQKMQGRFSQWRQILSKWC